MQHNTLKKNIINTVKVFLKESSTNELNIHSEYIDDLKEELSHFKTDEELLRSGGLSIEILERLAYGFASGDVKTLNPNQLKVKWNNDLENVKYEIIKSGLRPQQWASKINLTEPIDVSYEENKRNKLGFYIEDGHHRYMAAKILNKPLNINLEIKATPIRIISPNMGYDQLHRYIFQLYKNNML